MGLESISMIHQMALGLQSDGHRHQRCGCGRDHDQEMLEPSESSSEPQDAEALTCEICGYRGPGVHLVYDWTTGDETGVPMCADITACLERCLERVGQDQRAKALGLDPDDDPDDEDDEGEIEP